jgi:YozE SAM-like fold
MTFLEFIKSKIFDNTEYGDLAKEIVHDPELPASTSDNEIIGYLNIKTASLGKNSILKRILNEFERKTNPAYSNLYKDLYNIDKYVVR